MPPKKRDADTKGQGMYCLKCRGISSVLDTRHSTFLGFRSIRRRRICESCGWRWTTVEADAQSIDLASQMFAPTVKALRDVRTTIERLLTAIDEAKSNDNHNE